MIVEQMYNWIFYNIEEDCTSEAAAKMLLKKSLVEYPGSNWTVLDSVANGVRTGVSDGWQAVGDNPLSNDWVLLRMDGSTGPVELLITSTGNTWFLKNLQFDINPGISLPTNPRAKRIANRMTGGSSAKFYFMAEEGSTCFRAFVASSSTEYCYFELGLIENENSKFDGEWYCLDLSDTTFNSVFNSGNSGSPAVDLDSCIMQDFAYSPDDGDLDESYKLTTLMTANYAFIDLVKGANSYSGKYDILPYPLWVVGQTQGRTWVYYPKDLYWMSDNHFGVRSVIEGGERNFVKSGNVVVPWNNTPSGTDIQVQVNCDIEQRIDVFPHSNKLNIIGANEVISQNVVQKEKFSEDRGRIRKNYNHFKKPRPL